MVQALKLLLFIVLIYEVPFYLMYYRELQDRSFVPLHKKKQIPSSSFTIGLSLHQHVSTKFNYATFYENVPN